MKVRTKKALAFMLTIIMVVTMMPVTAFAIDSASSHENHPACGSGVSCGNPDHSEDHETVVYEPLSEALTYDSETDTYSGEITTSGSFYLDKDIVLSEEIIFNDVDANNIATINICLNGHTISNESDRVFKLGYAEVNICDCSDAEYYGYWDDTTYTISKDIPDVPSYDTMTGGIITGISSNFGGGIVVLNENAVLNMYGGNVAGCSAKEGGGGVSVGRAGGVQIGNTGGTFNMYGGSITGNIATATSSNKGKGGGVYEYYSDNATTFNMHGGTIRNNRANSGGGVYADGNNSTSSYSQFNMYAGEIINNNASEKYSTSSNTYGGGVTIYGNYAVGSLSGSAKISSNSAIMGGGIYVYANSTLNMTGDDVLITGNKAEQGGGVYSGDRAKFNMNRGKITGNTATATEKRKDALGGGVYSHSTFRMSGGEISKNNAAATGSNSDTYGGGIYVGYGNFIMSGGAITENTVSGQNNPNNGAGIYLDSDANVELSGEPMIYSNKRAVTSTIADNLFLCNYSGGLIEKAVKLTGSLGENAVVRVMIYMYPGGSTTPVVTVAQGDGSYVPTLSDALKFASDNNGFYADYNAEDSTVFVTKGDPPHRHDVSVDCGTSSPVVFTALTSGTTSLGSSGTVTNYYLSENVSNTASITINGTVNICLNGKKLTVSETKIALIVSEGAVLNICDCIGGGSISVSGESGRWDPVCGIQNSGTVSIYGGTIESTGTENYVYGIYNVNTGAALTVNGGTVSGYDVGIKNDGGIVIINDGTVNSNSYSIDNGEYNDGGVGFGGTVIINGGTINGNNICNYGSTFNINGGTVNINDNAGLFESFSKFGNLNISAGTVNGNIYSHQMADITIEGGEVNGVISFDDGDFIVKGGTIGAIAIQYGTIINIGGELEITEPISIYMDSPGTFTSGWAIMGDAIISDYFVSADDAYIVAKDETTGELKLVDKSPTYTVEFDANGGNGEMADQTINVGEATALSKNIFTRTGYSFAGWATSENGETVYSDEQSVTDIATPGAIITLYAQWTAYEITQQPTKDNGYEVSVNPSEGVEYTWHEKTETPVTTENATVYEHDIYSSSYNGEWWTAHSTNDGAPGYFYIDLEAGDIVDITLSRDCTARVNIYHFYDDGQTVTRYEDWKMIDNISNLTLTAPATARYYMTVSLQDSGEQPTVKAKVISLGDAVSGQTTSKLTDGTDGKYYAAKITYPDGAVLISDSVCYVAPKYTVEFDANGGNGEMADQTINVGEATALSENTFTRTGYSFAGWATSENGEAVYSDEQSVTDIATLGASITLYAKWTAIPAEAPTITAQPQGFDGQNALVYGNIDKQLSVTTSSIGSGYEVTYQWYKNTENSTETAIAVAGGTSAILAIDSNLNAGDYYYYCKITVTRIDNDETASVETDLVKVTVKQKPVAISWSGSSFVYNGTVKSVSASVDNEVGSDVVTLTIDGVTSATDAGTYTATVTAVSNPNYTTVGATGLTHSWNIAQSGTVLNNIASYNGSEQTSEFTYGDTITVKVKAEPTGTAAVRRTFRAPAANEMALYYDGTQISDAVSADGDGFYVMTYNTEDNLVPCDEVILTAKYVGNANMADQSQNISATIDKATPSYIAPDNLTAIYGQTLADVILPAGFSWADSTASVGNAGTNNFVVTFTPDDTANYKVVENIPVSVTVEPKPISPEIEVTAPVAKAVPQTTASGVGYTATIDWEPAVTEKFAYNTTYTAIVTITPDSNYTTAGISENTFVVSGAAVTNDADSNIVVAVFPATEKAPKKPGKPSGSTEVTPEPVPDDTMAKVDNCMGEATCPVTGFTDTDSEAWYHDGVHYAVAKGIMKGVDNNKFEPFAKTDRATIVTVLYRLEGSPEVKTRGSFDDVKAGLWYSDAIEWAASNEIVLGYGDDTYGPDDVVTRQQMAAIFYRYAKYKGIDVNADMSIGQYRDVEKISGYAYDAMNWTVDTGLINGTSTYYLDPLEDSNRAQIATIFMRYCENIATF